MTENFETNINTEEEEFIEGIRWELSALNLNIKRESFRANQQLKDRVKALWFYDWDESWENIRFDISNVKKYLESIKNKSWSDLDVKSSELEKWVRTIAIQIAINYINMENWWATENIDLIDGIRGNQTWKWVKEFQTTYGLKNKDGLPGHETITKILEILVDMWEDNHNGEENEVWNNQNDSDAEIDLWETEGFLESRLNHSDIDNSKCINLLQNFKILGTDWWYSIVSSNLNDLKNKLQSRFTDEWWLDITMLQNPEIWNLLQIIINSQSEQIEKNRSRYIWKLDQESNENNGNLSQSWEDYKFENYSLDGFEEFICSSEWIAIIIDEIKSHIDTSHENIDGQYDKFYVGYPFSIYNLEIRLANAWEDKIHRDYYKKTYISEQLEEIEKLDVMSNNIASYIDKIVWNYRKSNKEYFGQDMVMNLEWFLSKWFYGVGLIETFSGEDQESTKRKDIFQWLLSSRIKKHESKVRDGNDNFILNTWDKQVDLQLKSYLYLYWRIFYPNVFKSGRDIKYYEDILPEVMKSILSDDDASLKDKINHKEFLMMEMRLKEERKKRDIQRRQEAAKIIKERNERLQSIPKTDAQGNIVEIQTSSIDTNSATWPELAAEANLWKELDDYNLDIEESEERKLWRKETAFCNAWKEFIQHHDNVKSLITQEQMRKIFDINNNSINEWEWQKFKELNPLLKDMSLDELEQIRTTLSGFSSYFNNAKEKLSDNSSNIKEKVDETIKTYAIWAVIDNVRDTFDVITGEQNWEFNWFQLDNEKPIKKEWDNIIISGSFNGSEIKVRYDLKTGELFMNSFLHRLSPSKIRLWIDSSMDYPIWTIKPFNDVLNDYYKFPPHPQNNSEIYNSPTHWKIPWSNHITHSKTTHDSMSHGDDWRINRLQSAPAIPQMNENNINSRRETEAILGSQMSLINEAIRNNTESKAQKNSAINNFMKTFNIISDSWKFTSWEFNKWSNLYDIIEIIENTWDIENGDIQSLEYFNNVFMPTIMDYSWLKWWEWHQYQEINKNHEKLTKYNGDNDTIKALQFNSNNYNPYPFSSANFNSSHQLWFAKFITGKDRQSDGNEDKDSRINFIAWAEPDWKLDKAKMENFIKNLEAENKDNENKNNNADKRLSGQLPNV